MTLAQDLEALFARRLDPEWEHGEADALIVKFLHSMGEDKAADLYEAKCNGAWWYV